MKFSLRDMFEKAKQTGHSNEITMWESIDLIEEMLDLMEEHHPEEYWMFIRKLYGLLFENHYGKEFAEWDVSQLTYTDKEGRKHKGCYWSCEQIEIATSQMLFPAGTTKWDKYVAFNAMKSDMDKILTDEQILEIAHDFYFADEDWGTQTKIWDYMCCKNS